jgi:mRNA interferase RelE/StbE
MEQWRVVVLPVAKKHLASIKDSRVQQGLKNALNRLREEPDKRGKALRQDLLGFRSLRAMGERYRIVYQVVDQEHKVNIVTVGIRKEGSSQDAYNIASQLRNSGAIQLE